MGHRAALVKGICRGKEKKKGFSLPSRQEHLSTVRIKQSSKPLGTGGEWGEKGARGKQTKGCLGEADQPSLVKFCLSQQIQLFNSKDSS